jgi:hypothetical protein
MKLRERCPSKTRLGVTELIDSPRVRELKRRHYFDPDFTINVANGIPALLGSGTHSVIQKLLENLQVVPPEVVGPDGKPFDHTRLLVEHKMERTMASFGIDLVGKLDFWYDGWLADTKTTKAFGLINGRYEKYAKQGNVYAWMLRNDASARRMIGDPTTFRLTTEAIVKDHDARRAANEKDYPRCDMNSYNQEVWDDDRQEEYVFERLRLHALAMNVPTDKDLPECTKEERWEKPTTYAVYTKTKDGSKFRKNATRVLDSMDEALDYCNDKKLDNGGPNAPRIDKRPGEPIRCQRKYCDAYQVCTIGQDLRKKCGVFAEGS